MLDIEEFILSLGVSNPEQRRYRNDLTRFIEYCGDRVTEEKIDGFITSIAPTRTNPATIKATRNRIKRYFTAIKEGRNQITMTDETEQSLPENEVIIEAEPADGTQSSTPSADTDKPQKKQVSVYLTLETHRGMKDISGYLHKSIGEILSDYADKFVADNQEALAEIRNPRIQIKY